MSEAQLEAIKNNWKIACDREHPDNAAACLRLVHTDMPALLAYAQVEVHNQTLLKLEVLARIRELSERSQRYQKVETVKDVNGLDTAKNDTSVGAK